MRASHTDRLGNRREPAERLSRALVGWEDTGEEDCSAALPPPLPQRPSLTMPRWCVADHRMMFDDRIYGELAQILSS